MNETRVLYIITEGKTDAGILHTLLDCASFRKVYQVAAGSYGNLSSVAKTIRLMRSPLESKDKILIVFDADSTDEKERESKVAMMRSFTGADYDRRIGVFCFVPNIEGDLLPEFKFNKNDLDHLVPFLKEHIEELRKYELIREMQEFLDQE